MRTRGAQLSAGYTVNTYSKPPLYDASKCGNVNDSADSLSFMQQQQQQQKTSALGKPTVDLFIARTDTRHDLPPTNQPAKVTVPSRKLGIVDFRHLSRRVSETVKDRVQVAIDH